MVTHTRQVILELENDFLVCVAIWCDYQVLHYILCEFFRDSVRTYTKSDIRMAPLTLDWPACLACVLRHNLPQLLHAPVPPPALKKRVG